MKLGVGLVKRMGEVSTSMGEGEGGSIDMLHCIRNRKATPKASDK